MIKRRNFIGQASAMAAGSALLPSLLLAGTTSVRYGLQLYTFREAMAADPKGTLREIAGLGIAKIETARSPKGHYYGLAPDEMKNVCSDLGMSLISGHVHLDGQWQQTMEEAVDAGQEYLICSSLPSEGQTADNYRKVAEAFNKAGESCKSMGLKFGYHNHAYEFESDNGEVLYDILLEHTDPTLVHMELDLGWVLVGGKDPLAYFEKYPGRFPLWHLKDMDLKRKQSTELGKGGLDIPAMMAHQKASGVKHIFIEQEEYEISPLESMKHNMEFLKNL